MKKIFLRVTLIIFLLISLVYVTNITSIPDNIVLFQGENLNLGVVLGVTLKEKNNNSNNEYYTIETSSAIDESNKVEKKKITVGLFNIIDLL